MPLTGVPLTEQELLNAQYTGTWLSDAKSYFSRDNSGAATYTVVPNNTAKKYLALSGNNAIDRQGLLQTAILWATSHDKLSKRTPDDDSYMSQHQGDKSAQELESYFNSVFDWVGSKFKQYRKEEKGLDWGVFYNNYQNGLYKGQLIDKDGGTIEKEIIMNTLFKHGRISLMIKLVELENRVFIPVNIHGNHILVNQLLKLLVKDT